MIAYSFKLEKEHQSVDFILEDEFFTVSFAMEQHVANDEYDCFAFWKQYDQKSVSEDEFGRNVKTKVIALSGDSSLFLRGKYVLWYGDKNQCIIGTNTAYRLFGSTNVAGKYVTYNDKKYLVLGVTDEYEDLFAYEADKDDSVIFDRLSVTPRNDETKARLANRIRSSFGISGLVIDYEVKIFLARFVMMLGVIVVLISLICSFNKYITKKFDLKNGLKLILDASTFAVVLTVTFVCLCKTQIPPDYLPVRWSDYQHWGVLVKEKMASLKVLKDMKKCL